PRLREQDGIPVKPLRLADGCRPHTCRFAIKARLRHRNDAASRVPRWIKETGIAIGERGRRAWSRAQIGGVRDTACPKSRKRQDSKPRACLKTVEVRHDWLRQNGTLTRSRRDPQYKLVPDSS